MARKIVITSGKGGVGKTTVCANLGLMLAKRGLRVVLLDVDLGLNNLDVVSGIEGKIIYDVVDILEGKCRPCQALVQDTRCPSLYILPSAHSYNVGKVNGDSLRKVVEQLAPNFDYILIDCPAGIESGFHRAVFCASEAMIVTTPHMSAIRDANKVAAILNTHYTSNISLVVNRVRGDMVLSKDMLSPQEIATTLKLGLAGTIPESDYISSSASVYGDSLAFDLESEKAFQILAENVHNGTHQVFDCTQKYKGMFGKLKRNLKRRI